MENVISIVHLSDPSDANKYLAAGWVRLASAQYMGDGEAYIVHALGWPKEAGEPVHPETSATQYFANH